MVLKFGKVVQVELWLVQCLLFDLTRCHLTHGLTSLVALKLFFKLGISLLLHVKFHNLILIDLLMNELLSITTRELVFGNVSEFLMH